MKVAKMVINNYRQFEKAELNFDDNVTILAGANNSGKTSLITLIKNMMSKEQAAYSESDIPAKNMRVWLDKVYPLFEKFYKDNNEIDELETELLDKILPESEESERLVIKTTEVYIQVEGVNNFVSMPPCLIPEAGCGQSPRSLVNTEFLDVLGGWKSFH